MVVQYMRVLCTVGLEPVTAQGPSTQKSHYPGQARVELQRES